jgi:hypothetical protein
MGGTLLVSPRGHKWGNTWFPVVCEHDGIKYSLGKPGQSDKCSVAKVEISSLKLGLSGLQAAYDQAREMLNVLGLDVSMESLHKIDVCLDQPDVDVAEYCESLRARHVISRIRSKTTFTYNADGSYQGCATGNRKGCRIIMYDKPQEMRDNESDETAIKRQFLIENRYGGVLPDKAARIEFSMRGVWLRGLFDGMDSVQAVIDNLPAIMDYVVQKHFRIVDGSVDRENNNQKYAKLSPLWQSVCDGFSAMLGPGWQLIKASKKVKADADKIIQKANAACKRVIALAPANSLQDRREAFEFLLNQLSSLVSDDKLFEDVARIHVQWDAKGVYESYTVPERPSSRWRVEDLVPPF